LTESFSYAVRGTYGARFTSDATTPVQDEGATRQSTLSLLDNQVKPLDIG